MTDPVGHQMQGRFPWMTWSDLADRLEAAEAERDEARRVILMVGTMLGQAITLTEYERVLVWLDSQPVARAALAKEDTDE